MYVNLAEGKDMEMIREKLLGAMGLARRAGKLVTGAEMCEETIRAGKAVITFICSDLSENAEKKLHAALKNTDSQYIELDVTKNELAERFGKKSYMISCVITDEGMAKIVYKALDIAENNFTRK